AGPRISIARTPSPPCWEEGSSIPDPSYQASWHWCVCGSAEQSPQSWMCSCGGRPPGSPDGGWRFASVFATNETTGSVGVRFVFPQPPDVQGGERHLQHDQGPGAIMPAPRHPEDIAAEEPPETMLPPAFHLRGDEPGGQH